MEEIQEYINQFRVVRRTYPNYQEEVFLFPSGKAISVTSHWHKMPFIIVEVDCDDDGRHWRILSDVEVEPITKHSKEELLMFLHNLSIK